MSEFSKSRLAHLHEVMAGYVEPDGQFGKLPGLVTLVSRRGETHIDTLGVKALGNPGNTAPMRRDTLFRISSMTKPITAVAAMILVEECKLRLDEPVDRLLPELADRRVLKHLDGPLDDTVPANRPITLRDLLTFRMGFGQRMESPDDVPVLQAAIDQQIGMGPPAPAATPAPDEWLRRLGALPLMQQPGERWLYHTSADVLGVLIARAAGQPFEDFLQARVFAPLGMKDTGFSVPESKIDRLATSYIPNDQTGMLDVYDPSEGGQWSRPPAFPSGGGGLVSTMDDYFAFSQMLMNKGRYDTPHSGHERVLSRASVELMTTDQITAEQKRHAGIFLGDGESQGWGFGMTVITRRTSFYSIGTYGWAGGMGTTWSNDPHEALIMILLTQNMWTSPAGPQIADDFATLAYRAIED